MARTTRVAVRWDQEVLNRRLQTSSGQLQLGKRLQAQQRITEATEDSKNKAAGSGAEAAASTSGGAYKEAKCGGLDGFTPLFRCCFGLK